jgi:hypothetical protein
MLGIFFEPNRSLIKNLTARDLESRKIASLVERLEQALMHAVRFGRNLAKRERRNQEQVRGLFLRKRRAKMHFQSRERSREATMSL